MFITVNNNFTKIITNYTWYQRYKVIFKITGGLPLRLRLMPDSAAARRTMKCSNVTWARSTQSLHTHQLVFPICFDDSGFFETVSIKLIWLNVNHDANLARLLRFVLELFLPNTWLTSGQIVCFKWCQHSGASGHGKWFWNWDILMWNQKLSL